MMSFVTRDALGGASGTSTIQPDIGPGSNQCANNRKITTLGSDDEWGAKSIVITMNIRVCLCAQ